MRMEFLISMRNDRCSERSKMLSIVLMLVLFIFITAGCTKFDINIGIDADNTAYLSYFLEVDVSELNERQQHSFKEALHQIAVHYHENLGFVVNLDLESNPIVFEAEKRVANDCFEQAFESLKAMLTDEDMTVFMQVDMDQISYPQQMGYIISASADIQRIIESNDIEELPPGIRQDFEDSVEAGTGTITITLPADEVEASSHNAEISNGQLNMAVPLDFTQQTEFELSARQKVTVATGAADGSIVTIAGATFAQMLSYIFSDSSDTTADRQIYLREIAQLITIAAAILMALTLLITIVVVVAKRRRHN